MVIDRSTQTILILKTTDKIRAQYVQEELAQKCKNLQFEWIGFGAIKFISTSPPQELLKTLRSINRYYSIALLHI